MIFVSRPSRIKFVLAWTFLNIHVYIHSKDIVFLKSIDTIIYRGWLGIKFFIISNFIKYGDPSYFTCLLLTFPIFFYSSFTILQHLAIWGNLVAFYVINWILSALPSSGMYTIMFRLCRQPSYWITMFVSPIVFYSLSHFLFCTMFNTLDSVRKHIYLGFSVFNHFLP